jgi:hypothetical protein
VWGGIIFQCHSAFDFEFRDLEIHFSQRFDRMLKAHLTEKWNLERSIHLAHYRQADCVMLGDGRR